MRQPGLYRMLLIVAAVLALAGCLGGETTVIEKNPATLGEELVKLKEAYDKGALTVEEYEDAKKKLLDD